MNDQIKELVREQIAERTKQRINVFTTGDVARLWHVTTGTVNVWIRKGYIDAYRISYRGWYFIPSEEVERVTTLALNAFANNDVLAVRSYMRGVNMYKLPKR